MSATRTQPRRDPFPFVLAELEPIRPTIKRMFGFTYVYQGEMLLCALRGRDDIIGGQETTPGSFSRRGWSSSKNTRTKLGE